MCQKNPEISQEMELKYFRIYLYFINKEKVKPNIFLYSMIPKTY